MVKKSKIEELARAGNKESDNNAITSMSIPELSGEPSKMSFAQLDEIVQRGAMVFYEVGRALAEIRDRDLYRPEFESWEAYCSSRLDFGKRKADRWICASKVVADLGPIGPSHIVPRTESQAREIGRLTTPEERHDTWQEIVEQHGDAITAEVVKEAVDAKLKEAEHSDDGDAENLGGESAPLPGAESEASTNSPADPKGEPEPEQEPEPAVGEATAVDPDSTIDHPDLKDDPEPEPEGDVKPETEEEELFLLSDGTVYRVPGWGDGLLDRPVIEDGIDMVAKHYERTLEAAVHCEKLLLELVSKTNAETAGLDGERAVRYTVLVCQTLLKLVS